MKCYVPVGRKHSNRMVCKFRPPHPSLIPWLSAAALWLLVECPAAVGPDGISPSALRPTGEFLVLGTAAWMAARWNLGRALVLCPAALAGLLLAIRIDYTAHFVALRSEPLLYDQFYTLQHFLVLIADLFTFTMALAGIGVTFLAIAAMWLVRALARRAALLASPAESRRVGLALAGLWVFAAAATALGPRDAWIHWMTPALARNAKESVAVHRSLQAGIGDSPYRGFRQLRLTRKPDVFVFFVESYGRVLATDRHTGPRWAAALSDMSGRLSRSGWYTASAFSTAPVSGGRSWLAVGSVFFGAHIRYQGVFQRFVDGGDRVPSLPRFFQEQGYATVNLAPSVHVRHGVELENRYGYATYLRLPDLEYQGPRMGWGIVPDQYALGLAEERVLSRVAGPLFLHFHMVASHLPWDAVPEYVPDWRAWNSSGRELAKRSSDHARRPSPDEAGGLTAAFWTGYERTVLYDFRVVEDFLSRRTRDTLVILMGDHQPPILTSTGDGFDVPLHVIARDPDALDEFLDQGFSPGLAPSPKEPARVKHEGLFSLVVRALARTYGNGSVPEYFANGVRVGS